MQSGDTPRLSSPDRWSSRARWGLARTAAVSGPVSVPQREEAPVPHWGFGAARPECPAKFGTTVSGQRDNQVVTLPIEQRCTKQIAAALPF